MAKLNEDAAQELPLNDEKTPQKVNRHVAIAQNHLNKRREVLVTGINKLSKEIKEIDQALVALQGQQPTLE